ADPRRNVAMLWQADVTTNVIQPLLPDWTNSGGILPGGWSPDGRYFFFTALGDGTRNVWAIRETKDLIRRINPKPVQITSGPLTFYLPAPSKDGKSVFVVGEQLRGQLMRYDSASNQFAPYAGGISADHITYSRDGQWMAYVEFPSFVLVRSRVDGTEILFSASNEARSNRALYTLDLNSKQVSRLPGSEGLYWGQISPDGKHVIALQDTTQRLMLYDVAAHNTRVLAELADYPRWSS